MELFNRITDAIWLRVKVVVLFLLLAVIGLLCPTVAERLILNAAREHDGRTDLKDYEQIMILQAVENINLVSLADTAISLTTAFVLGSVIGYERQYRQRTAGLRTNVLVAVGAALFVDMAMRLNGIAGATQVTAYVVSGVGFLGAGAIMRGDAGIRGLNTAATLWGSAAVGACAGADLLIEAVLGAMFVLLANTLLRPVANRINNQPLQSNETE